MRSVGRSRNDLEHLVALTGVVFGAKPHGLPHRSLGDRRAAGSRDSPIGPTRCAARRPGDLSVDGVHVTVLLEQVVQAIEPREGGLYVDATLGAGGHAEAILEIPGARLIWVETPPEEASWEGVHDRLRRAAAA